MKKGRLNVYYNNGLVCGLCFDGKSYKLKNREILFNGNKKQLNNAIVEFEMERGKVTKIIYQNNLIYNIPKAKAPYNFISLNKNETFIESANLSINKYLTQEENYFTGYFDIEAYNKTAIFVRGTVYKDLNHQSYYHNQEGTKVRIDNYCPTGSLGVPGSTVRGMIRNLIEIVSFGKYGSFNDKDLYFRSFADDCRNLRDYYNKNMGSDVTGIKSGLVFKEGKGYKLIPNGSSRRVNRTDNETKQYFTRISAGKYLVHSGFINGKLYDLEITCPEQKQSAVNIPVEDVNSYKNDNNRSKAAIDILKEADSNNYVPCFYFIDGDKVVFGHTRFFRLPYLYSISDSIYSELIDCEIKDLVNAMFGDTQKSGKLFFEDLKMFEGVEGEVGVPKILSSPKPTSLQLYLEQDDNEIEHLNHYDTNGAIIRGNKLYWHKSDSQNWKENQNQHQLISRIKSGNDKIHTIIKPISSGAKFGGRIRFENLSSVELGALLFVLKLKDGLCHKIGMAKPLGLGSLEIKPSLHLSDRKMRYKELVTEWGSVKSNNNDTLIIDLIQSFTDAVWNVVDKSQKGVDLWNHPRLKQLEHMLDWKNKPSDSLTEYMNLAEFKHRMVLPTPDEI